MTIIQVIYPAFLAESAINTLCMNNSAIIEKFKHVFLKIYFSEDSIFFA